MEGLLGKLEYQVQQDAESRAVLGPGKENQTIFLSPSSTGNQTLVVRVGTHIQTRENRGAQPEASSAKTTVMWGQPVLPREVADCFLQNSSARKTGGWGMSITL